ncbi:MAG TPA: hypothetical protein PLS45_11380 [Bacillota bacterium]|jgi:Zn-finger nucleic acid-binding protein|nr:hypothetical protein [Bacillota bacterium]HQO70650.1 hypothetical protein [Clostridia bacterium]
MMKAKISNDEQQRTEKAAKVYIIDGNKTYCPVHPGRKLDKVQCNLDYYKTNHYARAAGTVKDVELLYCPDCSEYYADMKMKGILLKSLRTFKREYNFYFSIKSHSNSDTDKQHGNENEFGKVLKDTSDVLGKYGYSTKLSDERRWDIIINKSIPSHGVRRVLLFLEWLIFMKKSKEEGQYTYSNAIGTWEKDIKRIRRHYGI